ncbi:hypothetical protein DFH06DRAFT_1486343 [Mycena polygramma]|nr:hypothetical protein DFH06DRAFT_1486343 [Mycena polygramma]
MDVDNDNIPVRVEDLWFPDGSLVIQAQASLFRVYYAVLAARSDVFKDMLALPQPADGEETIEGCPVVRLPDAAEDVACFLRAIFDSSYFEPSPSETEFCTVISILRLSNKYGVDYLRRRALMHLSSGGPMTLSEYDKGCGTSITDTLSGTHDGPCILAVRIAREIDAPWILPSVFYVLAETRPTYIRRILDGMLYEGQLAKLSEDDKILFLKSSMHISHATHDLLCFLHSPDTIPGCEGKPCRIQQARRTALAKAQECISTGNDIANPLGIVQSAKIWRILKEACCRTCIQFCQKAHKDARKAFWDRLPEICDLPPWEELEKLKEQAFKA